MKVQVTNEERLKLSTLEVEVLAIRKATKAIIDALVDKELEVLLRQEEIWSEIIKKYNLPDRSELAKQNKAMVFNHQSGVIEII